jgi:hypothetical protein
MEPQLSVLLYSKYSASSKSLMSMIQQSGVDFTNQFSLQSLCIDNEEIRKRIVENNQLQITSVPCLLIIFPDGGIEKYDGAHVFEWVERTIKQFAPPPPTQPPQPPPISEEEQWRRQQVYEQKKLMEEKQAKDLERARIREENKRKYETQYQEDYEQPPQPQEQQHTKKNRRRIRKQTPSEEGEQDTRENPRDEPSTLVTSIDDLPSDEDDEIVLDRYRHLRPVGRIRSDEGNYIEGEELFQGHQTDMRRATGSSIKDNSHSGEDANTKKSKEIMAKAHKLAKGREEPPVPPGHPLRQIQQ